MANQRKPTPASDAAYLANTAMALGMAPAGYRLSEETLKTFGGIANRINDREVTVQMLLQACEAAIEATGGSAHWNGETEKFLLLCEAAVARVAGPERVTGLVANAMRKVATP